MSVNSKARPITTFEDLLYEFKVQGVLLHALLRDRRGFSASETKPIGTAAGAATAATGMLRTEGDTMIGPLAFFPQIVSHDATDNSINIGKAFNDGYSSRILLSVGPTTVNLDYIHDAAFAGQLLDMQGILTESFTIRTTLRKTITNIVGDGATQIITVTVADTSDLASGEFIKIAGTVNFDIDHVEITVTGGTTFTYDLGSVGSASNEIVGTATRGNIRTFDLLPFLIEDNDNYWLVFDIASNEWNIFGTGGGGISFPLDFPITFLGTIGSITQIIDFSLSTRHGWKAEFNGDVELAFDNPPTGEQGFATFKFKQDVAGDHILTLPIGTINKDIVEAGFLLGSEEETGIVIQFFDNTFYAFLETGNVFGGGGGTGDVVGPASATDNAITRFDGTTGKLIQNSVVSISDLGAIAGVTGIDLDGATATIQGVQLIDLFQADQKIESLSTGIDYFVDALQTHEFKTPNGSFMAMDEVNATDRRLDIKQNRIINTGKYMFSPTFDLDTVATAEIYETLTLGNLRYVSNNAHVFVQEGIPTLFTIGNFAGEGGLIQDIALMNFNSLIGEFLITNGDFQLDGIDMKVFSGNAVRNLSNIGVAAGGANVNLSNLTATSVNDDIIPQAGKTLGDSSNPWSNVTSNKISLETAGSFATSDNAIIADATEGMEFHTPAADAYRFFFGSNLSGVPDWNLSVSTLQGLDVASSIELEASLTLFDTFTNNIDPTVNGQFRTVGPNVKVFSGGAVRNLSDIQAAGGANVNLSNLASPTAINQDLIPDGSFELGSLSDRWNTLFTQFLDVTNTARFDGDVILGNTDLDDIFMNGDIETDINFATLKTVNYADSTNNAILGNATNLPAAPFTYIKVKVNGTDLVIPAFRET